VYTNHFWHDGTGHVRTYMQASNLRPRPLLRSAIESLCMHLPRHGDSIIVPARYTPPAQKRPSSTTAAASGEAAPPPPPPPPLRPYFSRTVTVARSASAAIVESCRTAPCCVRARGHSVAPQFISSRQPGGRHTS
jgi:hypothetical protein